MKNHGYISLESESDDGKSESDDELRAMKPPALAYNDFKHRIIRIVDSNKPSIANIENQNGKIHSNKLNEKAITENTLLPTWFIDELLHDGKPVHKITSSKNEAVNWTQKTKGLKSQPVQNITNTTKHDPTSEKNHMNLLIGPNSILSKPNILPQFGAPILQQPYVRPYYLENTASNWNPYLIQLQQQINHQNAVRYRNITAAQNVLFYQNKSYLPQSVSPLHRPPPGIIAPAMGTQTYMPFVNVNPLVLQHVQQKIQHNLDSNINMNKYKENVLPNTTQINNNVLKNGLATWADIAALQNIKRENPPVLETKNDLQKDKVSVDILTTDPQMFPSLQETMNKYQENKEINKKTSIENQNIASRRRKNLKNKIQ